MARVDGVGIVSRDLYLHDDPQPPPQSRTTRDDGRQVPADGGDTGAHTPLQARYAQFGIPTVPVFQPAKAPASSDPAAMRAYTDRAVREARESEKLADELKKPFDNGKKPEDDRTAWEAYIARRTAADSDRVRAEQAIAAELRAVYQANPGNTQATQEAARQIIERYAQEQDPRLESSVNAALKTVLEETPAQRETHIKLYEAHVADDKLNALMADKQAGKNVSDQEITAARDALSAARKAMMETVGKELDGVLPTITGKQAEKEDPLVAAANRIGARYTNDQELQAALDAEVILRKAARYQGPEQQMKALGELMPRTLDPTTRAFVLSDARGAAIVDRYVNWAASEVGKAYDNAAAYYKGYERSSDYMQRIATGTPPALAATQKLLELTNPDSRPYVTPEMTARIFNQLRTAPAGGESTMDRILGDVMLDGKWHRVLLDKDAPNGGAFSEYPTYNKVISNLSFAMENMGRAQDAQTGRYASPLIEQEVAYLGRRFAEQIGVTPAPKGMGANPPPFVSRFDIAFKEAASAGSAILALETAAQLAKPGAKFEQEPFSGWDPRVQAAITLDHVRQGIEAFDKNTKDLYATVNRNMAPVSSPLARFGMNMTEAQTQEAVANIFRTVPNGEKLYEQMMKDRAEIDLRGYRLIRLGETVGFYRHALGDLTADRGQYAQREMSGYADVVAARDKLLDSPESAQIIMLSNTAMLAAGAKVALKMIDPDRSHGQLQPQKYAWIAQSADFAEYWAETYALQGRTAGAQPGSADYGTWGDPAKRGARFGMPPDVAGIEKTYNPGEGRDMSKGRGGTYVRNLTAAGIEENNYNATRLGRFPLAGMAVWGAGGVAQVKLWEYIHNEVGFDKNEEWRKPFLEGVVGGFAAFHLIEAGTAAARLPAETWRGLKNNGWLESLERNAPLVYQKFDSALDREQAWSRFALTGTKGLTASLAGLMGIAAVWDISGVYYRAQDVSNDSQGVWGSKWWKVGTHGLNAVNDVLLLRLQLREFAKRAAPGLIEAGLADGALTKAATKLSASRLLSWVGSRALTANPIGFWVNVGYALTTGVNWVVDQNRYIKDLESYDNAFLRGAGIGEMQADLLKKHAFWTGDGKGDGFALGYQAVGGDPAKFVEYLNSQTDRNKLEAAIQAAGSLPGAVQPSGELKQEDPNARYLALPDGNPADIDLSRFPTVHYNAEKGRYEDSATGLYYDKEKKAWRLEDHLGDMGWYYYPDQLTSVYYWPTGMDKTSMAPTGAEGWEAYLRAHDMMPPTVKRPS